MFLPSPCLVVAVILAVLAAWPASARCGEAEDTEALQRLLHEFLAGASVNDPAAHRKFWADDLIYTSSSGKRFGKQAILDSLADGPSEPSLTYSAADIQVRLFGDIAVVAFRLLGRSEQNNAELMSYFNTGTFARSADGWQAVAWQATRIPAEN